MQLNNDDLLLTQGWVNNKEVRSDATFAVVNPANLEVVAHVSDLGAIHARDAIAAATAAFADWKSRPMSDRVTVVQRWANLVEEYVADLATIVCSENGKPLREARGEILQCAALLRWYAQEAQRLHGETLPRHNDLQQNYTIKQPIGVVACITPWNFPAAAVVVKAGAAIVTGCTAIIKPSDETPLIALALARLASEAGLPAGACNVVPCKNPVAIGQEICANPDVRMLSFTGSTKIGRQLYSACGDTVKRLALELGGNAPFIVLEDADLDAAVSAAVGARFYNSGQICVGANRFFVHSDVYQDFAAKLTERVASMNAGDGFAESSDIGPMINQAAIDRLNDLVESATALGAKVLTGGAQADESTLFFTPTVLSAMTTDMPAYRTEIFGPVACLYEFDGDDEVLNMANDTDAGLSAYVYTRDQDRLARFIDALEAGVVGANSANIFSNDLPFGGIKQSGIGREHGIQCLEEFVETKSVCLGL
jgi:succinate-semialdehyde dehydrogenase/glutarate-semialdehyde dehydrogenase